eukprot:scaffold35077_cov47-Prasinocladus_malaysianus.AAC.1
MMGRYTAKWDRKTPKSRKLAVDNKQNKAQEIVDIAAKRHASSSKLAGGSMAENDARTEDLGLRAKDIK